MFDVKVIGISPHHLRKTKVNTMLPPCKQTLLYLSGAFDTNGDSRAAAAEYKSGLGCVNSHPAAKGSKEAGFTQPRAQIIDQLCT